MASPLFDVVKLLAALGLANATRNQLLPPPAPISAKTAAYTILPNEPNGTLFTNRGAAGSVTFTLPAPTAVPVGTYFDFLGVVAQNIVIATPTADTLLGVNDVAADTVTISTAGQIIGAHARAICDGTQWAVIGDTVGITYTLAT